MMQLKDKVLEHWQLIPVFIISIFGFSFQSVPILSWFYIPLILSYARYQRKLKILNVFITCSIGLFISFLGVFRVTLNGPRYPNMPFIYVISSAVCLLLVTMLFADRYITQNTDKTLIRVVFFPTIWTSLFYLFTLVSGIGDFASITIPFVNWPDFAQVASLGGRPLLDFMVALFGTCLLELDTLPIQQLSTSTLAEKKQLLTHPMTKFILLSSVLVLYGGARVNIHDGAFFQASYSEYLPAKVEPVGCVVGPGLDFPDMQKNQDIWFEESAVLAKNGAKLILWSELTTVVNNTEDEVKLIKRARAFAKDRQVYIGITYGKVEPVGQNKLVFIKKDGEIGFDYNKAHPVPGVETQPAGPNVLQYVDTEDFGRVGGGICFDYNFPNFISQSSTHKVDLMLQPSWTWGPIGTYHEQSNILRAVENGFTLFRCVSQGVSGVFEPTLNSVYNQKVASLNNQKYTFYLPVQKRVATLYGYIGNTFSYACILTTGFILTFVTIKRKKAIAIE